MSTIESSTKREIARRNKRDQLQINISALDNLKEDDLKADKLAINLQELSTQIINKCPLLMSERSNLEDIQLHLLYLINRRQSQILTTSGNDELVQNNRIRPPSSASSRIKSAQLSKIGSRNSRRSSLAVSTEDHFHETNIGDYYCYLHAKQSSDEAQNVDSVIEDYLNQFDEYLTLMEQLKVKNLVIEGEKIEKIDLYLEGLYGESDERFISMLLIRKLAKDDFNLSKICLNKLLTCAMFRTLRESKGKDQNLSELILYCLIRFTCFMDSYYQVFVNNDQVDFIKIIIEFLVDHLKSLKANQSQELKLLQDQYYYTNSFLIIIINLLKLDSNVELSIKNRILKQNGQIFLNTLLEIFKLNTKYVTRDIRFISKPERFVNTQSKIVFILTQLMNFKEFINLFRAEHQSIFSSIVGLLNVLQLSRPGSGASNSDTSRVVSDKQLLNELFELEIDIFRLVNNLIFDHKLKSKFIKKNLLKCVLRNLVVFLASRKLNTLKPFDKSPVLVIPFKCLYELSCSNIIKAELYKSKIILKCLLEYLLSCAIDLKPALELKYTNYQLQESLSSSAATKQDEPPDQIIINPTTASHYIISIWINLSFKNEATIYADDLELQDLVYEYIDLAINNLKTFLIQVHALPTSINKLKREHSMIYLHSKLLRNISQFFEFKEPLQVTSVEYYNRWTQKMIESSSELLYICRNDENLIPITVESLATLNNLLTKIKWAPSDNDDEKKEEENNELESLDKVTRVLPQRKLPPQISLLFERLFELNFNNLNLDNDDLLLVLVIFMGNVAKNWEICDILNEKICSKILKSCNFILDNKTTDYEMMIHTLYTLAQFIKHSAFLQKLKLYLPNDGEKVDRPIAGDELDHLMDRFASLTLHGNATISKFAILLMDRLRHLDGEQQGSIFEKRFSAYNSKWLDAMKASREGLLGTSMNLEHHQTRADTFTRMSEEDELLNGDDGDEFEQLKAIGEEGNLSERTTSTASSTKAGSLYSGSKKENNENKYEDRGGDGDNNNNDDDELDEDDEELEGPDLNVIDQNSMIKHLTTRREFRSKCLWP